MKKRAFFWPLLVAFAVAFVLRIDLWQWHDPRLVFGLPVGLAYQVGFCFVVSFLLFLMLRFGVDLEGAEGPEESRGRGEPRRRDRDHGGRA